MRVHDAGMKFARLDLFMIRGFGNESFDELQYISSTSIATKRSYFNAFLYEDPDVDLIP